MDKKNMQFPEFVDFFIQALFPALLFVWIFWLVIGRRRNATTRQNLIALTLGTLICALLVAIFRLLLVYILNGTVAVKSSGALEAVVYLLAPILYAFCVVRLFRPAVVYQDLNQPDFTTAAEMNKVSAAQNANETEPPRPALRA